MILEGRVAWIFPDNFDEDFIVGVENMGTMDLEVLKKAVMKDYEPDFGEKIRPGDILVAGRGFAYGHPHPMSMRGLKQWGIDTIIAQSFYQCFFRGEMAAGAKLFVAPNITKQVDRWDELYLDTDKPILLNKTKGTEIELTPIGKYPLYLMEHGMPALIKAINSGEIN